MGLSHHDHAKRLANLNPTIPAEPAEPIIEIDRSGFMDPEVQRGFPICDGKYGFPGGATMKGTRPGDDVKDLGERGTLILRSMLKKARGR